MHLRDALIDADGNPYARGSIRLPPDPRGVFRQPSAKFIRIGGSQSGNPGYFTSCNTVRDPISGYLAGESFGVSFDLPLGVSATLGKALARGAFNPVTFALDEASYLRSGPEENAGHQGLSDWRGRVRQVDDDIVVSLSAALRTLPVKHSFGAKAVDAWPMKKGIPQRIEIEFRVNEITRVVSFGAFAKSLSDVDTGAPTPVIRTSLNAMRLTETPLGMVTSKYAITDDGQWVSVYETSGAFRKMSIDAPGTQPRHRSGLWTSDNRFPRIEFAGIDLDVVAQNMWSQRKFRMAVSDCKAGHVEYASSGYEGPKPHSDILQTILEFELTLDGLVFIYSAQAEKTYREALQDASPGSERVAPTEDHWLRGKITFPWEILILRSPLFVRHKKSLLEGKANPWV